MNIINNRPIIIGIDHGYGNIKTANCCFKTGVASFDKEPTFCGWVLIPDIAVVDTTTGQISIKSYGIRYQFFRVCAEKGCLVPSFVFMIPKRQEVVLNRMILVPTG